MTPLQRDVLREIRPLMRNRRIYLLFGFMLGPAAYFFVTHFFAMMWTFFDSLMGAILLLIEDAVLVLAVSIISAVLTRQKLNNLTEAELYTLSEELPQAITFKSTCVVVTENFVIGRNIGLVIMPIDEILLVYDRSFSLGIYPIYASSVLLSESDQNFSIAGRFLPLSRARQEREEIFTILLARNPEIMCGATNENIRIYKEKVKQLKDLGLAVKR